MSVAGKPPNRMVNRAIKPVQKVESRVSPGGGVATFGPTLRFPLQILQSLLSMIGIRFLFFFILALCICFWLSSHQEQLFVNMRNPSICHEVIIRERSGKWHVAKGNNTT